MNILEYVLWSFFVIGPIYVYFTHEKEQQDVIEHRISRSRVYARTMFFIWLPTILLLLLVVFGYVDHESIGLRWSNNIMNIGAVVLTVIGIIYSARSLLQLREDKTKDHEILASLAHIKWFMPQAPKELNLFVVGVSVSAGICEEILFRGYLLAELSTYMPVYMAVALSSLLFGLPHLYQGATHIIRTACLGGGFAMLYLATDSLVVPIVLHILFDAYGGVMAYTVLTRYKEGVNDSCGNVEKG